MSKIKLLHAARVCLGYAHGADPERDAERAKAFERLIATAIRSKPDAVLFSGGLFAGRHVADAARSQAQRPLERLRAAGVPFVIQPSLAERSRGSVTALDALSAAGLVTLLGTARHAHTPAEPEPEPWLDVGRRLRIVGLTEVDSESLTERLRRIGSSRLPTRHLVLMLGQGCPPVPTVSLKRFEYVARSGARRHQSHEAHAAADKRGGSEPLSFDPGPLVDAEPGNAPVFVQLESTARGELSHKVVASGASLINGVDLDLTGVKQISDITNRVRRACGRSLAGARIELRLRGRPDIDDIDRMAVHRALAQALAGGLHTIIWETDVRLGSGEWLPPRASRAAIEAVALKALVVDTPSGRGRSEQARQLAIESLSSVLAKDYGETTQQAIVESIELFRRGAR